MFGPWMQDSLGAAFGTAKGLREQEAEQQPSIASIACKRSSTADAKPPASGKRGRDQQAKPKASTVKVEKSSSTADVKGLREEEAEQQPSIVEVPKRSSTADVKPPASGKRGRDQQAEPKASTVKVQKSTSTADAKRTSETDSTKPKVKDEQAPTDDGGLWQMNAPRSSRSASSIAAAAAAPAEKGPGIQPPPRRAASAKATATLTPAEKQKLWNRLLEELDCLLKGKLTYPSKICGDGFCHLWAAFAAVNCLDGVGGRSVSQRDFTFRMPALCTKLREMAARKTCPCTYVREISQMEPPVYDGVIAASDLKPNTAEQKIDIDTCLKGSGRQVFRIGHLPSLQIRNPNLQIRTS